MKSQGLNPALFVRKGGELPLSGSALLELLRAVLHKGKSFRFRAKGFSMSPFVRDGDVITVSPLSGASLRFGHVVAFIDPGTGKLVVHRVVGRCGGAWFIQGDNIAENDGLIPEANLLGRVTRIERAGKRIFFGLGLERSLTAWLARHGWLLRAKSLCFFLRRVASAILQRMQSLWLYRALGRSMSLRFVLVEASAEDMAAVQAHFNPGSPISPTDPDPNATNYVAKFRAKVVGFVQLVRHPDANFPWVGHWLFSLVVWARYRGFGIGEALTRRVIEQAKDEAAADLLLAVFEDISARLIYTENSVLSTSRCRRSSQNWKPRSDSRGGDAS